MAFLKISELDSLTSSDLINSNLAIVPLVSDITSGNVTYKTTVANIKTYVENGDFTATGNITATGDITAGGDFTGVNLTLTGEAIITGNLNVTGNVNYSGSNNLVISDNVIELHVANVADPTEPWTFNDGKDIGLRFHYYDTADQNAALVFSHDERAFEFYSQGSLGANIFAGTSYGNLKFGNANIVGGVDSVSSTTGALRIDGGMGLTGNVQTASNAVVGGYAIISGNINAQSNVIVSGYVTVTGNVDANNVYATSSIRTPSYVYATALQVNTTGTFGTTLIVEGTATVNALTSNGAVSGTTGTFTTSTTTTALATGTLNANGTATVNALTSNGAISGTTLTLTDTANTQDIIPTTANTYTVGNSANWFANVYSTAVQALYADLAEKYQADAEYDPGTVVVFGGTAEITTTTQDSDTRVAGAISTDPAYVMNAAEDGLAVALRGKTPVKIHGPVEKGDLLVTSSYAGFAVSIRMLDSYDPNAVFAKSLETDSNTEQRTIWAVIL